MPVIFTGVYPGTFSLSCPVSFLSSKRTLLISMNHEVVFASDTFEQTPHAMKKTATIKFAMAMMMKPTGRLRDMILLVTRMKNAWRCRCIEFAPGGICASFVTFLELHDNLGPVGFEQGASDGTELPSMWRDRSSR